VSHYGIGLPSYWTGLTGQEIQRLGGKAAALLGAYLMFNDSMNMIGLYHLPVRTIVSQTPLTRADLTKAFYVLQQTEFADYDSVTEYTWVREMARYRLGLGDGTALNADDKRAVGAQKLYAAIGDNPFLDAFFHKYGRALHIKKARLSQRYPQPVALQRGLEGASKGLRSQVQDQVQVQGSGTGKSTGALRRPVENPVENQGPTAATFGLYCVIADEARQQSIRADRSESVSNISDIFKALCAQRGIAYTGDDAAKAIAAVLAKTERHA
jgi:hypothetical protein